MKRLRKAQSAPRFFEHPFKVLPASINDRMLILFSLSRPKIATPITDQDGRPDPRRGKARPDVQGERNDILDEKEGRIEGRGDFSSPAVERRSAIDRALLASSSLLFSFVASTPSKKKSSLSLSLSLSLYSSRSSPTSPTSSTSREAPPRTPSASRSGCSRTSRPVRE